MDNIFDLALIQSINALFWHRPFYFVLYIISLVSLVVFGKTMKRGRRFFFLYSVFCLVLFVYNPVFLVLSEQFLLHEERVVVRIFLLLPVYYTEAYVITKLILISSKRSKILASLLSVIIVLTLFCFGVAPWQREDNGWGANMFLLAENPYKIPQEHIEICEAILNDMDGYRTTLALFDYQGSSAIGGAINFSIRMYTSRIQLLCLIDANVYNAMPLEERVDYWNAFFTEIQNSGTDSSSYYFLLPVGDERSRDLLNSGMFEELPIDSSNLQLLVYTP